LPDRSFAGIDAGGLDPYQHLVLFGDGYRHLVDVQNINTAVFVEFNGARFFLECFHTLAVLCAGRRVSALTWRVRFTWCVRLNLARPLYLGWCIRRSLIKFCTCPDFGVSTR